MEIETSEGEKVFLMAVYSTSYCSLTGKWKYLSQTLFHLNGPLNLIQRTFFF